MKKYAETKDYVLYNGTMQEVLKTFEKNSVDSIVCDPPYELNFMGKGWDNSGVAFQKETWQHCFDVLKPGGYLLAFGGSRTFHRIACAIEDTGFEIRDTIMWLYGSGFPKSMSLSKGLEAKEKLGNAGTRNKRKIEQSCEGESYVLKQTNNGAMGEVIETTRKDYVAGTDLAKQWQGWGTCLKPAYEPVIVARKPFKGSLVDNVIENGVGGLNIDECRVGNEERNYKGMSKNKPDGAGVFRDDNWTPKDIEVSVNGRFPANVILDDTFTEEWSRYFYCAKASKKDRDEGLEEFEDKKFYSALNTKNGSGERLDGGQTPIRKNIHPTVKPTELMQYLVRLVTPKGGIVMDCFMGSGSTGKAVMYENKERNAGYSFIGIEMTDEYLPICEARINYAYNQYSCEEVEYIEKSKTENEEEQLTIFDFMEE